MRRALAWAAIAILAACAIYGFLHEGLFHQYLWTPEGVKRLVEFTAVFWAVAGLLLWIRPGWLGPVIAGMVLAYSVGWCWMFFEPMAPLAALYFLGSSFLLGRIIARRVDGVTALLLGLAAWSFGISMVVRFPVNTPVVYAVAFAIPYLVEGRGLRARRLRDLLRSLRVPWQSRREAAGLALLLFVLLMHWLVALKPEVSSDGLAVHLAVPMAVARDAQWTFDFERYMWALMPMGGDWAFTGAYLLGGEAAARLLNFALLAAIAAMIYQASRQWLAAPSAFVATALFVSTPLVQLVTGSLFVENVWAAMIAGAALALWRGELIWASALFGAALSTKVGTLAFVAPAVVIGARMLFKEQDARARWRTAALPVLLFAVLGAPPYLNAWRKTGNPVFPFANAMFRSPYFEPANTLEDGRFRKRFTWETPYETTFRSKAYLESQNGGVGFQYFLLMAPLLLLVNRRSPWMLVGLGAGGALLTFSTLSNLRYIYPALPLFSIGIAWLISEIPALLGGAVALTLLNVWFLPASGWYHQEFALFGSAEVDAYLKQSGPQRALVEYLNQNAPGESAAFFGGSAIAGFNGRAYADTWHTYKFWHRVIGAGSAEEVAGILRELGIRHVVARDPMQSDYPVLERFVYEWTDPPRVRQGQFALRDVISAARPLPRPRTVAGPGGYDDRDFKIDYEGAWTQDLQFAEPWDHSITYSNQRGASLSFLFDGSAITYVYTKAFNRGMAEISIDGQKLAPISLYSPRIEWRAQTVFDGLRAGEHTIEIRVSGEKEPGATDYFVDLDRFVVNP
jgi:hypothetical protein